MQQISDAELLVEIPLRFKESFIKRYDVSNFKENTFIFGEKCELCEYYRKDNKCNGCPFEKFSSLEKDADESKHEGCYMWIKYILKEKPKFKIGRGMKFIWDGENDSIVREQYALLRKKAGELFKFID